jgi:prepilin-type processing-associated H-X9-DG protein
MRHPKRMNMTFADKRIIAAAPSFAGNLDGVEEL